MKNNSKIQANNNSKVNKLQREYLSGTFNKVWTIDVTTIRNKFYWLFILDLASRRVVHYHVTDHDFTATEVTHVLQMSINLEASVIPHKPVDIVHTDSGGIFLSHDWKQCLLDNNIESSSSDSKTHQNQVSERFNRTFKRILRNKLNKDLNTKDNKTSTLLLILKATKYNFQNLKSITQEIIDYL
jgi:transposase InsO family protein